MEAVIMARNILCSVASCGKEAKALGLCPMHRYRIRRYGHPDGLAPKKPKPTCTIPGCQQKYYATGYCTEHYNRSRKYGDPLGGSTSWGAVRKWIDTVAIPYGGDDCLIFPYGRNPDGYGQMTVDGRAVSAHVFVLQNKAGPKPTPKHECCHNCGKGHLGCVTPRHLRWDTHAENMADTVAHGTSNRAPPRCREDHHDFRATDDVVAAIRADLLSDMTQKSIAVKYGFGQSHISRIKLGQGRFVK
jgi:hypothetical protein